MKDIFDECKLGNLKLKSRIIRTGLWESQTLKNGRLTEEIYNRYINIAKSGVGLITSELISLYPKDKFSNLSHKIYTTDFVSDFKRVSDIVHEYNVPIIAQLSFVEYSRGIDRNININDLTLEDIRQIQMDIISSAKKAQYAGFDGIQIALGNNFFLSKFINPYFNQRKDNYGKNTFDRIRMILEIIKVIKKNLNIHINCRINAYDGRKGGITADESKTICQLLEEYGTDSIQITKPLSPLYFTNENINNELVDYVIKLNNNLDIPVILGGGFHDKNRLNDLLNNTNIEYFSMYRPFVAQYDFLNDWKENVNIISRCKMCNNCYRQKTSTCYHFK